MPCLYWYAVSDRSTEGFIVGAALPEINNTAMHNAAKSARWVVEYILTRFSTKCAIAPCRSECEVSNKQSRRRTRTRGRVGARRYRGPIGVERHLNVSVF